MIRNTASMEHNYEVDAIRKLQNWLITGFQVRIASAFAS